MELQGFPSRSPYQDKAGSDLEGSSLPSPLSGEDELGSDGDCTANSPQRPAEEEEEEEEDGHSGQTGAAEETDTSGASAGSEAGKAKPYTRRPKPPYSYIALIAMAIRDSGGGRLTLAEINDYLMRKFPFFRGGYTGWRNSVRHNLSLNDCFVKVLRDPSRPWGKDNYWMLNPNSEYTFADGVFRRRRKRLSRRGRGEEPEQTPAAPPPLPTSPPPPKQEPTKFSSSFAIESILSRPFQRREGAPQPLRYPQQQPCRASTSLLWPPPAAPYQPMLSHYRCPPPLYSSYGELYRYCGAEAAFLPLTLARLQEEPREPPSYSPPLPQHYLCSSSPASAKPFQQQQPRAGPQLCCPSSSSTYTSYQQHPASFRPGHLLAQ